MLKDSTYCYFVIAKEINLNNLDNLQNLIMHKLIIIIKI